MVYGKQLEHLWWSWVSIDYEGKRENVMRKSKNCNMTYWWWLETWGSLANLSKWWIRNCAPHYLHEMWGFFLHLALPSVFWNQQNYPKVHKNDNFDRHFVRCDSCFGIGGTPTNYVWLDSPTVILCSLVCVKPQFRCGWKRGSSISDCLLK